MRMAIMLTVLYGCLQAQINYSVSTDRDVYSLSDSIFISISAINEGDYPWGLEFRTSCESAYFIGDWSSIADTTEACTRNIHMITLEPDSIYTWSWVHDLQANPIGEGLQALAGMVLTEWDATPTEPVFIQIGTAISPLPISGFFPNTDSLKFLCGCTPPELTLTEDSTASLGQIIQFLPFFQGELYMPSHSGHLFSISSGYYYVYDTTAQYSFSARLIDVFGSDDFAFDSTQIIWDADESTMRVYIHDESTIIDSISRSIQVHVSGAIKPTRPTALSSLYVYPNPSNDRVTVEYTLLATSEIDVKIFDILGREVFQTESQNHMAGTYAFSWNGSNARGENLGSGVYILQIRAADWFTRQKIIMLK